MDKSREQFEAYFIQYYLNDNPEMVELFLKRDGEGYKLPSPNDEWRVWQASRAAVEIELPDGVTTKEALDAGYTCDYAAGVDDGIEGCANAIRAAGFKVKGE
ncbi:hypothetical protein ACJ2YI_004068 [Cronobacter sakazakii]